MPKGKKEGVRHVANFSSPLSLKREDMGGASNFRQGAGRGGREEKLRMRSLRKGEKCNSYSDNRRGGEGGEKKGEKRG